MLGIPRNGSEGFGTIYVKRTTISQSPGSVANLFLSMEIERERKLDVAWTLAVVSILEGEVTVSDIGRTVPNALKFCFLKTSVSRETTFLFPFSKLCRVKTLAAEIETRRQGRKRLSIWDYGPKARSLPEAQHSVETIGLFRIATRLSFYDSPDL
jgi:hypothetical protein